MIERTACVTGHRAQKLPWGFESGAPGAAALRQTLAGIVEDLQSRGFDTFISGMATGADMLFAEAVLTRGGALTAAIPCPDQDRGWPPAEVSRYNGILERCAHVRTLSPCGDREAFLYRNRWMVDRSAVVVAVWDQKPGGGTAYTVSYARRLGREVILVSNY